MLNSKHILWKKYETEEDNKYTASLDLAIAKWLTN